MMTRTIVNFALVSFLALGIVTIEAGCPKGGVEELAEDEKADPVKQFQFGVALLSTPDKDGIIQYTQAYTAFVTAAELFDGKGKQAEGAKAHFDAAWTAEVMNNPADAEKHYRLAFEGDAAYDKAMFSLARILTENGKAPEAIALYRAFIAAHPDRTDVRNDLIAALSSGKLYDEAFKEAQDVLLKDPKNAGVYRALSSMYYSQGNYSMSALCAEKSLALNEGDTGTYNNLGVTYLLQKKEAEAIAEFKTALKLDPKNFEANMNLGFVALNSGDYALALACLQKAVDVNPQSLDAKLGLAVALRGNKDFTKSAAMYDEIIKADPQNDHAYFNAATLHEKYTKDFTRAQRYLDDYIAMKAGSLGPDDEVFKFKAEIEKEKTAEEARLAELKRLEAEKKAREERQAADLAELQKLADDTKSKAAACAPEVQEEVNMMIEQAQQVITDRDFGMATDVKSMFTDYYLPMVSECAGGAAPSETPAEGTPAETPPAETPAPVPQ
jgi:tetratricopeptide (TPR) repeat protein